MKLCSSLWQRHCVVLVEGKTENWELEEPQSHDPGGRDVLVTGLERSLTGPGCGCRVASLPLWETFKRSGEPQLVSALFLYGSNHNKLWSKGYRCANMTSGGSYLFCYANKLFIAKQRRSGSIHQAAAVKRTELARHHKM